MPSEIEPWIHQGHVSQRQWRHKRAMSVCLSVSRPHRDYLSHPSTHLQKNILVCLSLIEDDVIQGQNKTPKFKH